MKTHIPVTVYDLECTAKDAKNGVAEYRGIKVYWDDATNNFSYYNQNSQISKERAILIIMAV